MSNKRYIAYCGLYCGACSSMIVYDKGLNDQTAENVLVPDEELPCSGCDSEYQKNCEFVQCNQRHQTSSCAFCSEFPCDMILKFKDEEWEHHQVVINNLNRIKEIGEEAFLNEQKDFWKCPSCGSRTIWYQKTCTKCQCEITNFLG